MTANYGRQMSQASVDGVSHASMKPRSLILDLFGDYLRYAGSEVKAGDLVTLLGVFGIEAATVRVTLSRLRREHWFTTRRLGRETVYVLSDHMLAVLDDGRTRIFADYDQAWDRTWMTLVHQSEKTDRLSREQLRRQLSWLGFGPLSPSTWVSPHDRAREVRALGDQFPDVTFALMSSRSVDPKDDPGVASRCWDLPAINRSYARFLKETADLARTSASVTGGDALIARTTLIASYRHFPFIDPWLPAQLRPEGWLGSEAHARFRVTHLALGQEAGAFVSTVIRQPLESPAA